MKRDNQPFTALPSPTLTWQEGGVPYSSDFDDVYFSSDNGLEESRYTFLLGNALPDRWASFEAPTFVVAETGFGTGLNFLLTLQAWIQAENPKPNLHFLSIENFPLQRPDLEKTLEAWPSLASLAKPLIQMFPPAFPGNHRLEFENGRVILDLHWGNALEILAALTESRQAKVDAWYLDGFAPAKNKDMWSSDLLGLLPHLSNAGASLATFTAAGAVRRDLAAAGFNVRKVPGFGCKRESLRGTFEKTMQEPPVLTKTPWEVPRGPGKRPSSAIVIGAGLAGCWTARALAMRGVAVTLLEKNHLASAGSGNAQGVLYTRISHHHSLLVDFGLHSYLYASRLYAQLFQSGALVMGKDGELCGSFQAFRNSREKSRLEKTFAELGDVATLQEAPQASEKLGIELSHDGYWLPDSGWLNPPAVCRALISSQKTIALREDCGDVSLNRSGNTWRAIGEQNEVIAEADCAVIAVGTGAASFAQSDWLPLRPIRGQTSDLPASEPSRSLKAVLCHEGYIAPAREGLHCVGASFNLDSMDCAITSEDHKENLQKLAKAVPTWKTSLSKIDCDSLAGKVGFRCASPDYLPTVGPLPNVNTFVQEYAALRDNAKQVIDIQGSYIEDLYVTAGHGSRGLTSTPISAEILAGLICKEPIPLERDLYRALSPARFLIRGLMRDRKRR